MEGSCKYHELCAPADEELMAISRPSPVSISPSKPREPVEVWNNLEFLQVLLSTPWEK